VRLDEYPKLPVRPCDFRTHDRRIVAAFFGRDREVNAVSQMIAVIKWRTVIVVDVLWVNVLPFLGNDLEEHSRRNRYRQAPRVSCRSPLDGYFAFMCSARPDERKVMREVSGAKALRVFAAARRSSMSSASASICRACSSVCIKMLFDHARDFLGQSVLIERGTEVARHLFVEHVAIVIDDRVPLYFRMLMQP
jgi:hypothetical protein